VTTLALQGSLGRAILSRLPPLPACRDVITLDSNIALRKLLVLDAAGSLEDLRVPPANRLEKLSRDRRGQHSLRINDQWRICFHWRDGHAHEVEIVDYH